jgi:sarcosine oxidase gamma subunit
MDEQALSPGLRLCPVTNATVLSLRHQAGDDELLARELQRSGLPWPRVRALARVPPDGWMVRLSPRHSVAVGRDAAVFKAAIQRLAPGRHAAVMAIDTSEGHCVIELVGPGVESLLRRAMDADPAPETGHALGSARVTDVPVIVVPLDAMTWCLIVDRPLAEYLMSRLHAVAAGLAVTAQPESGHVS